MRKRWLSLAAKWLWVLLSVWVGRGLRESRRRQELREREAAEAQQQLAEAAEATLPPGSIWPVMLALGIFFGLWGIILNSYLFGIGLGTSVLAVAGWMWLLLAENAHRTSSEQ